MRSQVRFFMDAADERRFVDTVLEEPQTFLINGPHWKTASVPVVVPEDLSDAETYLMIWNKAVIPRLRAKRNNNYWEAYNESTTIQFLRCRLWDEVVLTERRIAVASDREGVERLYSRLRKIIQQAFKNQLICWFAPDAPKSLAAPRTLVTCLQKQRRALPSFAAGIPNGNILSSRGAISLVALMSNPWRLTYSHKNRRIAFGRLASMRLSPAQPARW